jgi:hypothetical protein
MLALASSTAHMGNPDLDPNMLHNAKSANEIGGLNFGHSGLPQGNNIIVGAAA